MTTPASGAFNFSTNVQSTVREVETGLRALQQALSQRITLSRPDTEFLSQLNRQLAETAANAERDVSALAQAFARAAELSRTSGQQFPAPGNGASFESQAAAIRQRAQLQAQQQVGNASRNAPESLRDFDFSALSRGAGQEISRVIENYYERSRQALAEALRLPTASPLPTTGGASGLPTEGRSAVGEALARAERERLEQTQTRNQLGTQQNEQAARDVRTGNAREQTQQRLNELNEQILAGTARRTGVNGGNVVTNSNQVFNSRTGLPVQNPLERTASIQSRDRQLQREERAAESAARALERHNEQLEREGRGSGLANNFLGGLTSRGFGSQGGFSGNLDGLAASAGTLTKYQALNEVLQAVTGSVAALKTEYFDFIDSQTVFNAALDDGTKITQGYVSALADISSEVGSNVGEAIDTALRGAAAFSTPEGIDQEAGKQVATAASQLRVITGKELKDATGDLLAVSTAYSLSASELERVNDAVASAARNTGADRGQISQGLANFAISAKEAGFSLNEAANLLGLTLTKIDETGQAAATRLTKVFAILGGTAGQNAIAELNASLSDDTKQQLNDRFGVDQIDKSAAVKDQLDQLSIAYSNASEAQQSLVRNQLGGTSNTKELLVVLANLDRRNSDNAKSADDAGIAAREYEERLKDITGTLRELSGNLRNFGVALADTGLFDLLGVGVKVLLPLLEGARSALQSFNAVGGETGKVVRGIVFALGELALGYKALVLLSKGTGLNLLRPLGVLPGVNRLPGVAVARGVSQGAAEITSQAAFAKTGGVATPQLARLAAAEVTLAASVADVSAAQTALAEQTAANTVRLRAAQEAELAARTAGGPALVAAQAEVAAAQHALAETIAVGSAEVAAAANAGVAAQAEVAAASAPAAASAAAYARAQARTAPAIIRTTNAEERLKAESRVKLRAADDAIVRARTQGGTALQRAEARRVALETQYAAEIEAATSRRLAAEQAQAAAVARAVENPEGGRSRRLLSSGNALGIGVAGAIGIAVVAGLTDKFEKIQDAADKAFDLVGKGTGDRSDIEGLRASADDLQRSAAEARAASGGIIGTAINFLSGNQTGQASDLALSQAQSLRDIADKTEKLREDARRSSTRENINGGPAGAIDLGSADRLSESYKRLGETGRNAETRTDALRTALERFIASAQGAASGLNDLNSGIFGINIGPALKEQIAQTIASLNEQESGVRGSLNPFSSNRNERDRDILKRGNLGAIESQATETVKAFLAANGGQLPTEKGKRDELGNLLLDVYKRNIPDFDKLSGDLKETLSRQAISLPGRLAREIDPNFNKQPEPKVTPAQAKADLLAAQRRVSDAKKQVADAQNSGDARYVEFAGKELELAKQDLAKAQSEQATAIGKSAKQLLDPAITAEAIRQLAGDASNVATEKGQQSTLAGGSGNLTSARTLLSELQKDRATAVKLGAKDTDLEELDSQIAAATIALNAATANHVAALGALAVAQISPFDKSGRIAGQLNSINKQLATTTDQDERAALLAQKADLTQQQIEQTAADVASERNLQAQRQGTVGLARAAAQNANAELQKIKNAGVTSGQAFNDALAAKEKADLDLALALINRNGVIRTSRIDPRDTVGLAREKARESRERLAAIRRNRPQDSQAIAEATTAARADALAERQARVDLANAVTESKVSPGSSVSAAQVAFAVARRNLGAQLRGTKEYYAALKEFNASKQALADAVREAASEAGNLRIDLTDPVAVANKELQDARNKLAADRKAGAKPDVINKDTIDVRKAQDAADQAAFSQRLQDAQTADGLGRISHTAYLAYLAAEHKRLAARLATLKVTDEGYRQTLEQFNQIEQAEQAANEALSGQFNFGDIQVPKPFEVRRAIADKLSVVKQGLNAANDEVSGLAGQNSSTSPFNNVISSIAVTGAVTKLQQLRDAINDLGTVKFTIARAGTQANAIAGSQVVNVNINGGDVAEIKRVVGDLVGVRARARVTPTSTRRNV